MVIRPVSTLAALMLTAGSAIVLPPPMAVLSSAVARSFAQAPPQSRKVDMRGWLKELNLSPDQLQKIRQIRGQYQGRLTQQRQAVQQAQQELKEFLGGNASTEQIRQKFEQVQRLKQDLANTRMESMLAIRKILNPEQRQKLADLMRQRRNNVEGL